MQAAMRAWGDTVRTDQRGFTLVELLVVMLILGILSAIAVPAYMGQKHRAQDAATREDVRIARIALETVAVQKGTYNVSTAELLEVEPALSGVRNLQVSGNQTNFFVAADSPPGENGGTFAIVRQPSGRTFRLCAKPGQGGCRATADSAGNYW